MPSIWRRREEEGATRVREFLHRQLHLISDCNSHTHTHVYLYMCTDVYKSPPLSISLTLRGYLCIAEWNDIWNMCQVPLHLLMLPDMTPTRSTREVCTNVPNVRMHVYVHVCLCVCVASGISSCLATIWVSLAGTVRAAEATHETCLLINTTMNHFTLPARGEWAGKMPLFRFICICVCMFVCIYVGICIVHMYVHMCCTLLSVMFAAFASVLWFLVALFMICLWFSRLVSFSLFVRFWATLQTGTQTFTHTHTHGHLHAHSHTFLSHAPLALFLSVFRTICVIRALASLGDLPQPTRTFVPLLLAAVCVAVLVATPRGGNGMFHW